MARGLSRTPRPAGRDCVTVLADVPRAHIRAKLPVLAQVWLITLAALAAMSLPNLADPMIRYDDFPALLAEPSGFWAKTLHEGRWVNYLWHLREVVTPSWLNFALYQALWALFAACVAVLCAGRVLGAAAVIAILIVIAPPATLISLWFNTLIPGLALVVLYAWIGVAAPQRVTLWLMPVFVVVSFMAYTTYPLLILLVCLLARDTPHRFRDLMVRVMLFGVSFAGAVLAVYTLNYVVHGVFGVPLAAWREAVPASDLAGVKANLPLLWDSLAQLGDKASFGFAPMIWFHLVLFTLSAAILLRYVRGEALYLLAGLAVGLALVTVQILKMGAVVPPRGFIFVWVVYAAVAGRAVQILAAQSGGELALRMMRNAVFLVIGSYALQTFLQYGTYRAWQAETRAVAERLPHMDMPVLVSVDALDADSAQAAFVQDPRALSYRITQITGLPAAVCAAPECRADIAVTPDGRLSLRAR